MSAVRRVPNDRDHDYRRVLAHADTQPAALARAYRALPILRKGGRNWRAKITRTSPGTWTVTVFERWGLRL